MNAHEYKRSCPGRCFCHPFRPGYKAGTDCKRMAAQCVKGTGDKQPLRATSLLKPNLIAGSPTPALVPHCSTTFTAADHQDDESQHRLLVLSPTGAAPFSLTLTSHLTSVQVLLIS